MSESTAPQVEIREVDGQTLRKLVDYIYTAEIEVTEDNVQVGEAEFTRSSKTSQRCIITATIATTFNKTGWWKSCCWSLHIENPTSKS